MFNLKSLCNKALFALMLALGAGAASAGPTYHVTVNTAAFAGEGTGSMLFVLAANDPAVETIASLSNFSGAFAGEAGRSGGVSGALPGAVSLVNSDTVNFLVQSLAFGGLFGFDVTFSGNYETTGGSDGANFAVSLFNAAMDDYLAMDLVSFDIVPAFNGDAAMVNVAVDAALADAALVPEPSELLLMLTGLGLMGVMLRRRTR